MTDREKLIALLHEAMIKAQATPGNISINVADYLISHGVVMREKGAWIAVKDNTIMSPCYECSVCGRRINTFGAPQVCVPFCHCGADMRSVV